MSYTVGNGDILEVSFSMRQFGQNMLSVFHYQLQLGGAPVDGLSLITAADAVINLTTAGSLLADHVTAVHETVSYQEIVYQWIYATRRARVTKTPALLLGDVTGTPLPPNSAAAVTKRSDTAGRHGVGTLHMPGLAIESVSDGVLNATGLAYYTPILTSVGTTITPAIGQKLIPVIYNRSNPELSQPISTALIQDSVRTMHRRTVGVGQ